MQSNLTHLEQREWNNCLVGTLETWSLADVVLWLHQTNRTALVRVGTGLNAGVLFFRSGQLYRCEWGMLNGEAALVALLSLRQGSFSLMQRDPPDALANIHRGTGELLLQIAVAQDHAARRVVA